MKYEHHYWVSYFEEGYLKKIRISGSWNVTVEDSAKIFLIFVFDSYSGEIKLRFIFLTIVSNLNFAYVRF